MMGFFNKCCDHSDEVKRQDKLYQLTMAIDINKLIKYKQSLPDQDKFKILYHVLQHATDSKVRLFHDDFVRIKE